LIVKREKKIEKRKTVSKLADALVSQKCRIWGIESGAKMRLIRAKEREANLEIGLLSQLKISEKK
jgi:hypothetical protein